MGIKIECDGGCGETTTSTSLFKRLGVSIYKYYCPNCVVVVEEYIHERDLALQEAMAVFQSQYDALKEEYTSEHPGMELPDA